MQNIISEWLPNAPAAGKVTGSATVTSTAGMVYGTGCGSPINLQRPSSFDDVIVHLTSELDDTRSYSLA